MSTVRENMSMDVHVDGLDFVDAALEAAAEDGELDEALEQARGEVAKTLGDGAALIKERDRLERLERRARIKARRAERAQERALRGLWAACMAAASQDKEARVVKLLFDGGVAGLLRLSLEAQNKEARRRVELLGEHEVYAGALRAEHVPALQVTVDAVDNALAERDKLAVALAGQAERELLWKQRANTLRTALSGQLVALGATRGEPSPRDYARSFFSED